MKKLFPFVLFILFGTTMSVSAQDKTPKTGGPQIVFDDESHNFGTIKEGIIAIYTFRFTNTGDQPLVLKDVRPSCGCTTPDWSKEPVQPGKTGQIIVKFNSAGRPGKFNKSITVTSNIPDATKILFISGTVTPSTDNATDPNQSPVRISN